jgi:hypothetical protein
VEERFFIGDDWLQLESGGEAVGEGRCGYEGHAGFGKSMHLCYGMGYRRWEGMNRHERLQESPPCVDGVSGPPLEMLMTTTAVGAFFR